MSNDKQEKLIKILKDQIIDKETKIKVTKLLLDIISLELKQQRDKLYFEAVETVNQAYEFYVDEDEAKAFVHMNLARMFEQ